MQNVLDRSQRATRRYDEQTEEVQASRTYQIAKRCLDICGALVGILILVLLLPIVALLIFWEDRGPIFYQHIRVGQHGRPFVTYKFRTMMVNADEYLTRHPELRE